MEIRLAVAKDKKKILKYDCHIHHNIHNGLVDVLCDGDNIVGVVRTIFKYLLNDVKNENPTLEVLTLNSSPYGLPFYLAIGFVPQGEEQTMNGIRFTPMKYILKE